MIRAYYIFVVISFSWCNLFAQSPQLNPVDFSNGLQITVDDTRVSGIVDLTDFYLHVDISDASLRNISNAGSMQNANGYDILFVGECDDILHHDIELYTETSGRLMAWVRLPILYATQPTVLTMYYGNATMTSNSSSSATWNAEIEGNWHLQDDFLDETSNDNDGTNNGSMDVTGYFGDGQDFNGTSDYIQTTSNNLKNANDFSLSLWFRADQTNYAHHLLWQGDVNANGYGNPHEEMHLTLGNYTTAANNDSLTFFLGDIDVGVDQNVLMVSAGFTDLASWHHVYVNVNNMGTAPTAELYLDGVLRDTDGGSLARTGRTTWDTDIRIGRPGTASRFYDGKLDEVRLATASRTADWITTEYNNQSSPATFYSYTGVSSVLNVDTIRGNLFVDQDADGVKDVGEVPYANARMQLNVDVNENAAFDVGDYLLDTISTDVNGDYLFTLSSQVYERRIEISDDDAEEDLNTGTTYSTTNDIDLGYFSGTEPYLAGLRYQDLNIPNGAVIKKAYIEFVSFSNQSTAVEFSIGAEGADSSSVFVDGATNFNLSTRTATAEKVNWTAGSWTLDQVYYSPDLSNVIQEVVDRAGWKRGNALSLLISGGPNKREFYTFDGDSAKSPKLHIEFALNPKDDYYLLNIDATTLPATFKYTTASERAVVFTGCAAEVSSSNDFAIQLTEICNNGLDDEGDGYIDCNDTIECIPAVPGALTAGAVSVCGGDLGEVYTINAVPSASSYNWTAPIGANITAGQGTTSITVDWGTASGDICVRSYNGSCYSAFSCTAILVVNIPVPPPLINH